MLAFQIKDTSSVPELATLDQPAPAAGEVLVKIHACGLNFADLLMAKGKYQDMPNLPATLGLEAAGEVIGLGEGVTEFAAGDRVAVCAGSGGLAEYGAFPASRCIPMPSEMTYEEAAGFQIAYGTSHLAMTFCTQVTKQDTVLITGAAGGVGLTAVQIASQLGARVIAVARGEDKLTIAREAGADITLDASTADLGAKLKELGGADVVYDTVGGKLFDPVFRACKVGGRFLVIGFAGGEVPQVPANILLVKNIQMIGLYWGGYRKLNPKALNDSLAELMRWYSEGRIKPPVGHTFPLEKTAEGLELMRSRQSTGKIVITMPE